MKLIGKYVPQVEMTNNIWSNNEINFMRVKHAHNIQKIYLTSVNRDEKSVKNI